MSDGFVEDGFVADDDAAVMAANASRINKSQAKQNVVRELSMQEDRDSQPLGDTIAHGLSAFGRGLDWTGLADEVGGVATAIPRLVPGGESPVDAYKRGRDNLREAATMGAEESPAASFAGDMAGQATGVLAGAAPAKAGIMAAKSVPSLVRNAAALGGAAGGVTGFGHAEGDAGQQAADTALGAGVGAAGGAALAGLPMALLKAAPSLGTTSVGQALRSPLQTVEDVGLQAGDSAGLVLERARGALAGGGRNALAGAIEKAPAALGALAGGALGGGPVGAAAGGMLGNTLLDDAAKVLAGKVRNKPPVAGPANAAAPTLDVPEPVLVPTRAPVAAPDALASPVPVMDEAAVMAAGIDPRRPEGLQGAANMRKQLAESPTQGGWSMTPDDLRETGGLMPSGQGRPGPRTRPTGPATTTSEAPSGMTMADEEMSLTPVAQPRPVAEIDDAMTLVDAVPPASVPPAGAVDDAPLDLEALAPKIEAPPPLASIESAPVDDLQALAARARQRGIDQRFSKGGQRERAQLQALSGKAERQAFFDDLANLHGQRQTAPLAREFALEMPSAAPRFSSMPGWMRQASNTGAHTGRQEASGTPFADAGGNGPAIREAFAQSRAPIADDAAQGLALEAQGAAALRPGQAFDAASGQPLPKYKPKNEAERAELMALPSDKFDAVVDGRMTLDEAQGGGVATFDEPSFIRKGADEMGIEGDDFKSSTWHARELGDAVEPGYVRARGEKRRKEMVLPLDRGEALREILQENGIDVAGIKERKIGSVDNFDAGKDKKKIGSLAQAWSKSTRSKKSWDEIGGDLDALAEALGVEKLRLPERVRNLMERHAIEDAPDLKTNHGRKIPK